MKKIYRVIFLFICILFLTGCRSGHDYELTIHEDKTMDFYFHYKNQFIGNISIDWENYERQISTFRDFIEPKNYTLEYEKDIEDRSLQIVMRKQFRLEDLVSNQENPVILNSFVRDEHPTIFTKTRKLNSSVYQANILWVYGTYYMSSSDGEIQMLSSPDGADDADIGFIYPSLGNSFKVHLPSKVLTTNATVISSDGKTLEWDQIDDVGENYFQFSFEMQDETAVKYDASHIHLMVDRFNVGDEVSFRVDSSVQDVVIQDSNGNDVVYEIRDGEYFFTMPEGTVRIQYRKEDVNPKTGVNLFTIILLIFTIIFLTLLYKKKAKKRES